VREVLVEFKKPLTRQLRRIYKTIGIIDKPNTQHDQPKKPRKTMCEILKPDLLLAILLRNKDKAEVTFKELRELRDRIQENNPSIVVDVSIPSIRWALYYYPDLFHQDGYRILRTEKASSLLEGEYFDRVFRTSLSDASFRLLENAVGA
jgi:hypothetical protein